MRKASKKIFISVANLIEIYDVTNINDLNDLINNADMSSIDQMDDVIDDLINFNDAENPTIVLELCKLLGN
jgi:hypothetical protein